MKDKQENETLSSIRTTYMTRLIGSMKMGLVKRMKN